MSELVKDGAGTSETQPATETVEVKTEVKATPVSLTEFSPKTLYQKYNTTVLAPIVRNFVNAICDEEEEVQGKNYEIANVLLPRETLKSAEAFIPSIANVDSAATPTATSIRRDVDALWSPVSLGLPSSKNDLNMVAMRLDYDRSRYANEFVENRETFIGQSLGNLIPAMELASDNRKMFGWDTYNDKAGTDVEHQWGIKDVIHCIKYTMANYESASFADYSKPITAQDMPADITAISQNYVAYKARAAASYKDSRLEAIAQLFEFIFAMENPNNFASVLPLDKKLAALKNYKIVATNRMIQAIKTANFAYFKDLKQLVDEASFVVMPETTLDTSFITGNTDAAKVAGLKSLRDTHGLLDLNDDELFIVESGTLKPFRNYLEINVSQDFVNNTTVSHWAYKRLGQQPNPFKVAGIFKAPILITQYALPTEEVSKLQPQG